MMGLIFDIINFFQNLINENKTSNPKILHHRDTFAHYLCCSPCSGSKISRQFSGSYTFLYPYGSFFHNGNFDDDTISTNRSGKCGENKVGAKNNASQSALFIH